jgi:glycosyltransferase involved in cell wall biosynthesis
MKILYLCPCFPFPATNGGEQAHFGNITELLASDLDEIKLFFVNTDNKEISSIPNISEDKYRIFNYYKPQGGILGELNKLRYVITSKYPRKLEEIANNEVKKEIEAYNPDLVIMDGLQTFLLLSDKIKEKSKIIYITHNIETDLAFDLAKLEPLFSPRKIPLTIIANKIKKIEKDFMNYAHKVICLSSSDYKHFFKKYASKLELCPDNLVLNKKKWAINSNKNLLFCGSISFAPNHEAVEWIVNKLAPLLPENITINITGTRIEDVPLKWHKNNIKFLGFVSKEKLEDLYQNSSLYLCPIIMGSGIKMKLVEALKYGMPILATEESLEGLAFLNLPVLLDRNNIKICVSNITRILNNNDELQKLNNTTLEKLTEYSAYRHKKIKKIIMSISK